MFLGSRPCLTGGVSHPARRAKREKRMENDPELRVKACHYRVTGGSWGRPNTIPSQKGGSKHHPFSERGVQNPYLIGWVPKHHTPGKRVIRVSLGAVFLVFLSAAVIH